MPAAPAATTSCILSSIDADRTAFAWREAPVSAGAAAVLTEKELNNQFSTLSYRDFGARARIVATGHTAWPRKAHARAPALVAILMEPGVETYITDAAVSIAGLVSVVMDVSAGRCEGRQR